MSGLLTTIFGCLLAVLTTLAPTPVWAMRKAQDRAWELVNMIASTWNVAADIYCSEHRQKSEMGVMIKDMEELQGSMGTLEAHIQHAWWECLGSGKGQQTRLMLSRLDKVLQDNCDRLFFVLNCCKEESFGKLHAEMLGSLKPHVTRVLSDTDDVMTRGARAACFGGFADEDKPAAEEAIQSLKDSIKALSAAFRASKQKLGMPGVCEDLVDEHTFCIYVCASGRLAIQFAEEVLAHQDGSQLLPGIEEVGGIASVFDTKVMFDTMHVNFVLRNTITILIGFAIGYNGITSMLSPYSAGIASTSTLLLSKFMGSAIAKNLERLQGVVLGTVSGQMVYACLAWCEHWWSWLAVGLACWLWVSMTMFTYFHSAKYSGMACLLAAFGSSSMLQPCHGGEYKPEQTYSTIVSNVVAIFVMFVADLLTARGAKASNMAHQTYITCWNRLEKILAVHFDINQPSTRHHKGKLLREIQIAEGLGQEAAEEPRFWRRPWKERAFSKSILTGYKLRICITGLEYCVAEKELDAAPKSNLFNAMLQMPTFIAVGGVVLEEMRRLEKLMEVFVHDGPGGLPSQEDKELWKDRREELWGLVHKFVATLSKHGLPTHETPEQGTARVSLECSEQDSLEYCPVSRVCLVLDSIDTIMLELSNLKNRLLRE